MKGFARFLCGLGQVGGQGGVGSDRGPRLSLSLVEERLHWVGLTNRPTGLWEKYEMKKLKNEKTVIGCLVLLKDRMRYRFTFILIR